MLHCRAEACKTFVCLGCQHGFIGDVKGILLQKLLWHLMKYQSCSVMNKICLNQVPVPVVPLHVVIRECSLFLGGGSGGIFPHEFTREWGRGTIFFCLLIQPNPLPLIMNSPLGTLVELGYFTPLSVCMWTTSLMNIPFLILIESHIREILLYTNVAQR